MCHHAKFSHPGQPGAHYLCVPLVNSINAIFINHLPTFLLFSEKYTPRWYQNKQFTDRLTNLKNGKAWYKVALRRVLDNAFVVLVNLYLKMTHNLILSHTNNGLSEILKYFMWILMMFLHCTNCIHFVLLWVTPHPIVTLTKFWIHRMYKGGPWLSKIGLLYAADKQTCDIQPMDQSVIATFQRYYMRRVISQAITENDREGRPTQNKYHLECSKQYWLLLAWN
jgi:hypothetical protein